MKFLVTTVEPGDLNPLLPHKLKTPIPERPAEILGSHQRRAPRPYSYPKGISIVCRHAYVPYGDPRFGQGIYLLGIHTDHTGTTKLGPEGSYATGMTRQTIDQGVNDQNLTTNLC